MIRVLHVLGAMNHGGIEAFIMNAYRKINREYIQFDFLVNSKNNEHAKEIEQLGGNIYYIPPRHQGIKAYKKNIDDFFYTHSNKYKVIHQHVASLSSIYVLAAAKKHHIKIRIIHSHSSSIKGSKLHYIFHLVNKLRIKALATHYLACSDRARHWLYDYTGCFSRSEILNNGIDPENFVYNIDKRRQIRQKLQLEEKEIALCHVGSFIKVKNHTFLLDILNELRQISPYYKLFLVGSGGLKPQITEKVRSLELEDRVIFLGIRKDVNLLMQGFDCLVFPSLFEGLPVTLVEAQAADLQVVCSDTISQMSKISEDITFLSLSQPASFWAKIIDGKLRERKRKNTTDLIRQSGYSIDVVIKKLEKIYTI